MKNFKILLLALVGYLTVSCSLNYDDEIFVSDFQGEWIGTYSGSADKGIWAMEIQANGDVIGSVTSELSKDTYEFYGTVKKNGNISEITGTSTNGASFIGKMSGNTTEGIWTVGYSGLKSEWSGRRK
ncbi:hypothetical protein [Algoriphagus antarcticus]|nr:hypothetical protein [Algoriphagus antarcticus]